MKEFHLSSYFEFTAGLKFLQQQYSTHCAHWCSWLGWEKEQAFFNTKGLQIFVMLFTVVEEVRGEQTPNSACSEFQTITTYAFRLKNGLVRTTTYLFPSLLADPAGWIPGILTVPFSCSPINRVVYHQGLAVSCISPKGLAGFPPGPRSRLKNCTWDSIEIWKKMVTFCCLYYVFVALLGSQPQIKPADGFVKLSDRFCWQRRGIVTVTSPPHQPIPSHI